eukprot:gnl/TRDRNA2_/TRDRNA2_197824_c0_seq1.p1 gnl/TRDRNA2_/TRDRNA2_197824_c0~~gnl/TRDRNA2_/TRDRNA2_197824_c0_seq1.p1  ORF type:complete len:237 (+),score=18.42 gnl/TRDRNA2_/TRDRNA2_197824_c0_seq1:65-775(+)
MHLAPTAGPKGKMSCVLGIAMLAAADALRLQDRANEQKVKLTVVYETYCPSCQYFITNQLHQVWYTAGFQEILDMEMLPYGNAEGHGTSTVCQHGTNECTANMVHECALKHIARADAMAFVFCAEGQTIRGTHPEHLIDACMEDQATRTTLQACVAEFNNLDVASRTYHLNNQWTPWVVLNEVHSTDAENNLLAAICNTYTGSNKPHACASINASHVHFPSNHSVCPRFSNATSRS